MISYVVFTKRWVFARFWGHFVVGAFERYGTFPLLCVQS